MERTMKFPCSYITNTTNHSPYSRWPVSYPLPTSNNNHVPWIHSVSSLPLPLTRQPPSYTVPIQNLNPVSTNSRSLLKSSHQYFMQLMLFSFIESDSFASYQCVQGKSRYPWPEFKLFGSSIGHDLLVVAFGGGICCASHQTCRPCPTDCSNQEELKGGGTQS